MRPEKMRLQLACEELAEEVNRLFPRIAPHNAHAAEHLRKSAQSTLFNACEGIAAWNPKLKRSEYEIARREANEVRAILRMVVRHGILSMAETRRAYNLAGSVIGMLVSAARSVEEGKGR